MEQTIRCGTPGWGPLRGFLSRHSRHGFRKIAGRLCQADKRCLPYSDSFAGPLQNLSYLPATGERRPLPSPPFPNFASSDRGLRRGHLLPSRTPEPPQAVQSCGTPGWGPTAYYRRIAGISLQSCKDTCLADPRCLSYSDSTGGFIQNCYLYSQPAKDVLIVFFPFFAMFDRNCGVASPPTLSSRSTTSTLSSTRTSLTLSSTSKTTSTLSSASTTTSKSSSASTTTSKSSSTSTTSSTPTPSLPGAPIQCAVQGDGTNYYTQLNFNSILQCQYACKIDTKCLSSEYRSGNGDCWLYALPWHRQRRSDDGTGRWIMNDRDCITLARSAVPRRRRWNQLLHQNNFQQHSAMSECLQE